MSYYEYHVPRRYVQFPGALREVPKYVSLIGGKCLFLTACGPVRKRVEEEINQAFSLHTREAMDSTLLAESPRYAWYASQAERLDEKRKTLSYEFYDLGEAVVCEQNIRKTAEYVRLHVFDTVVGIGGGKAQDYTRALTHFLPHLKIVLIPTIAVTNASASTLSVLYSQDGSHIESYWRMDNAPDLVLVDTNIILDNPPSVLVAGIGDILCTYYEAICNLRLAGSGNLCSTFSSEAIFLAAEILQKQAYSALEAMREHAINQAFETVVSMIMHNCGPLVMICTLGYAHVLDELFLAFDAAHRFSHGLRVGFATIAMLRYAQASELKSYSEFCQSIGIPTSLSELGLAGISREQWLKAAEHTITVSGTIKSLPFQVTPEQMIDNLLEMEGWRDCRRTIEI